MSKLLLALAMLTALSARPWHPIRKLRTKRRRGIAPRPATIGTSLSCRGSARMAASTLIPNPNGCE